MLSTEINTTRLKKLSVTNFKTLSQTKTPTLTNIKIYQGEPVAKSVLHELIWGMRDMFNFRNNLNDAQCELLADLILTDFYHFTIADIKLCFAKAIKGDYGQVFQNIDIMTIFSWFNTYLTDRTEYNFKERQIALNELYKQEKDERANKRFNQIYEAIFSNRPKSETTRKVYTTLETWFNDQNKNGKEEAAALYRQWSKEYEDNQVLIELPFEGFCNYRIAQFLNEKNK